MLDTTQAGQRARDLILFADGLEEAGMVTYAQRARMVAHDTLDALQELAAERSARRAVQARAERLEQLLLTPNRNPQQHVETAA